MPIVEFHEMDGYPQETRTLKGFEATRKLIVAWDDRYLLRELLIGHPPELYPYIEGFGARVSTIAMQPTGQMSYVQGHESLASYQKCLLTVRYETPRSEDPQPYPATKSQEKHENPQMVVSETFEPYGEAIPLPVSEFKWEDGTALTADETPVRLVLRAKYGLTRHNQTGAPPDLLSYVGKCNSAIVTPALLDTISFAVHTLLFEPPTIEFQADDEGQVRYDLTYRFLFKEEGWRKFWRAQTEQYETIHHVTSGVAYAQPEEIDFNDLLP